MHLDAAVFDVLARFTRTAVAEALEAAAQGLRPIGVPLVVGGMDPRMTDFLRSALGHQIAATSIDIAGAEQFRYRLDLQYEDSGDIYGPPGTSVRLAIVGERDPAFPPYREVDANLVQVAAARAVDLVATADVVRRGRRLSFLDVTVRDPSGAVVAKALAKHPTDRYASAAEMRESLLGIRARMREAFYTDTDAWKGQVVSQARERYHTLVLDDGSVETPLTKQFLCFLQRVFTIKGQKDSRPAAERDMPGRGTPGYPSILSNRDGGRNERRWMSE